MIVGPESGSHSPLSDGVWTIDPSRSRITFTAAHRWGLPKVQGSFVECGGGLTVAASTVGGELIVWTHSLDTGSRRRDHDLRSSRFLDEERHPQIRLSVTAAALTASGLDAEADLAILDMHLPLRLRLERIQSSDGTIRLRGGTTISLSDVRPVRGLLRMVRDKVAVAGDVTLTRSSGAPHGTCAVNTSGTGGGHD